MNRSRTSRTRTARSPLSGAGAVRRRLAVSVLAGLCSAAALSGCGYGQHTNYPDSVRTVAVPIFTNRTFYQGLERDVTEALIKEIEFRTPYKVTSKDRADTILQGSIERVTQPVLSVGREGGMAQELEMRLLVNFEWKDLRSGEILRQRRGSEVVGRYMPARRIGEPLSVAQHDAAAKLADRVLSVMQAEW